MLITALTFTSLTDIQKILVILAGFEPATPSLKVMCSTN